MKTTTPLLGGVLDARTAAVIGLPRASGRGLEWHFGRAGLPYSLANELRPDVDRTTLASFTESIIANLDPRGGLVELEFLRRKRQQRGQRLGRGSQLARERADATNADPHHGSRGSVSVNDFILDRA